MTRQSYTEAFTSEEQIILWAHFKGGESIDRAGTSRGLSVAQSRHLFNKHRQWTRGEEVARSGGKRRKPLLRAACLPPDCRAGRIGGARAVQVAQERIALAAAAPSAEPPLAGRRSIKSTYSPLACVHVTGRGVPGKAPELVPLLDDPPLELAPPTKKEIYRRWAAEACWAAHTQGIAERRA